MQNNEHMYDITIGLMTFTAPASTTVIVNEKEKFYEITPSTSDPKKAIDMGNHVDKYRAKSHRYTPPARSIKKYSSNAVSPDPLPSSVDGTVDGSVDNALDSSVVDLLQKIAAGEGLTDSLASSNGYDSPYEVTLGYGKYVDDKTKRITTMTLDELQILMQDILDHPDNKFNSSASGYYQIVRTTLRYLIRKMKLNGSEIFDKELQDKFGKVLLDRRGLSQFAAGSKSKKDFQHSLSKEWDSIASDRKNRNYRDTHDAVTTTEILGPMFDTIRESNISSKSSNKTPPVSTSIEYYQEYIDPSPIALLANGNLKCPSSKWMISNFGRPGKSIGKRVDNNKLFKKYRMPTQSCGPFNVTGFPPFIEQLRLAFTEIETLYPELYGYFRSDGMQACRLMAGNRVSLSSHSWGHALDIKIGNKRSKYGYRKHLRGLDLIIPIMNKYKIFSGITFGRMDSMHFQVSKELYNDWVDSGKITFGNGTFDYTDEPFVPEPEPQSNENIETNPDNEIIDNTETNPKSIGKTALDKDGNLKIIKDTSEPYITRTREFTLNEYSKENVHSYSINSDFKNHVQLHVITLNNMTILDYNAFNIPENIIKIVTTKISGDKFKKEQFFTIKHVNILSREVNDTYVLQLTCLSTMVDRLLTQDMYSVILENSTSIDAISSIVDNINKRFETITGIVTNTGGTGFIHEQIFIKSDTVFNQMETVINGTYKLNRIRSDWILVDTGFHPGTIDNALTLIITDTSGFENMQNVPLSEVSNNGVSLNTITNTKSIVDPGIIPVMFQSNVNLTQPNGQVFFKQKLSIVEGFKKTNDTISVISHEINSTMTINVNLNDTLTDHNSRMESTLNWMNKDPSISKLTITDIDATKISPCIAYKYITKTYDYTIMDHTILFIRQGDDIEHSSGFHAASLKALVFHFRN